MRYLMFLFFLGLLFLAGCTNTSHTFRLSTTNEGKDEQISSGTSIMHNQHLETQIDGNLLSTVYITGLHIPLIISNYSLIVSGIFSVDIPKDIITFDYMSQYTVINDTYYEQIFFENEKHTKGFNLGIYQLTGWDATYEDKDICAVDYFDGYVTKSENVHISQGRNIYIHYAILMANGLDVEPSKIIDTQFCFIDSGMVYKFYATNYTHEYMDQLIDSLTFLD